MERQQTHAGSPKMGPFVTLILLIAGRKTERADQQAANAVASAKQEHSSVRTRDETWLRPFPPTSAKK
jgi:hypothetical protein